MKTPFLKSIFGSFRPFSGISLARAAASKRRVDGTPVAPEALETRRLMSVSVSQNTTTNTLTITGDENANEIHVYQQEYIGTDQITVEVVNQGLFGPYGVDADLTLIVVNAGGGGDTIIFGSSVYGVLAPSWDMPVGVPAQIHGDYDSDVIWGTDQADTIWGDQGNDQIRGAAGNDTLFGGYGDGAETGNDTIWGDAGADSVYGEAGNDVLHGANDGAADYLDGGSGTSDQADRDAGTDTTVGVEWIL
jgi:Ca2+-binding RTX toxin-like protein